jgi:hypothetical protein
MMCISLRYSQGQIGLLEFSENKYINRRVGLSLEYRSSQRCQIRSSSVNHQLQTRPVSGRGNAIHPFREQICFKHASKRVAPAVSDISSDMLSSFNACPSFSSEEQKKGEGRKSDHDRVSCRRREGRIDSVLCKVKNAAGRGR